MKSNMRWSELFVCACAQRWLGGGRAGCAALPQGVHKGWNLSGGGSGLRGIPARAVLSVLQQSATPVVLRVSPVQRVL